MRYARETGHRVVVVDGDANAVGFRFADVAEVVDFSDTGRVAAVGAEHAVDGVLAACSDRAVRPAAAVAEALSLPSIGVEIAHAMTDKAVMRTRLAAAGVRQPGYRLIDDHDPGHVRQLRPAVLKPVDSGGQRGVFRIDSLADLERHLAEALSYSYSGRAILEDHIEGTELNGILVVRDGEPTLLTLSDRLRPEGRGFGVGWIHSFPSALDPRALRDAREVAFAAVSALGLRNGIAFPQLIVDDAGAAWLIEIAARIPAGQMADLVSAAVGVNLYEVAIRQALGLPVPDELIAAAHERPVVIRFLTAEPGVLPVGTVKAIEGIDAVRASDGVLAADLYFGPGHVIRPVQVDADRNGYVIATGADPSAALACADAAAAKLVIRVG
jgi:biotin carboxylase